MTVIYGGKLSLNYTGNTIDRVYVIIQFESKLYPILSLKLNRFKFCPNKLAEPLKLKNRDFTQSALWRQVYESSPLFGAIACKVS